MEKIRFKDKVVNKISEWKAEAEHLNLQLHLGIKEAEEEFEKQKRSINNWAEEIKGNVESFTEISKDKVDNLKSKLEDLQLQAALGRAETKDALKDQQKAIKEAMHNVKQEFLGIYSGSKESIVDFLDITESKLEQYQTRIDLLSLKFHLGKKEAQEEWEERKRVLQIKLHELNVKIDSWKNKSEDKLENFTDEMKEVWKHLKKSILN